MSLDHIRIPLTDQRDKLFQRCFFLCFIRGVIDHEDFLPTRTVAQRNGQKRITRRIGHRTVRAGESFDIDLHAPQIFERHALEKGAPAGQ